MIEHLEQLAVHAFYAGEHEVGRRACDRLLGLPGVPFDRAMRARANRTWYTQALADLVGCRFQRIDIEPAGEGWSLFNPSLISHDGRLVGVVRSSNYRIENGRYVMPEADGQTIKTINLLVDFSNDLLPNSVRPLQVNYPQTEYPVTGLEDCRLRHVGDGLGVSATVRNVAPFDGRCRIAIGTLAGDTVTGLRVLDGLATQLHEKNWMPIEGRGGWLYCCNHAGHVVTVDQDHDLPGGWQIVQRSPAPQLASEFRGGSQLIRFRDGWLCLVHEVAHLDHARAYEHRWAWFDGGLRLQLVSPAFYFRERQAIEFAAGLAARGNSLVVSFGVRDAEAWLVEVSGDEVWQLLSAATSG